ncbi:MAG: hypothetical protein WCW03_01185 [Candidatus Paceibacterota bacterium]|jgi:uncharacterized membrane protein YphA (DoxX/SURF4 family)
MLSIFPSLLTYEQLSPFLIRLSLGAVFLFWAYRSFRANKSSNNVSLNTKIIQIIEGLLGIMLIIGLWTQLAALIILIDLIVRLIDRIRGKAFLTDGVNYYLLLLIMAISLLVTGAGFFAFDMPL